jgi:uncharacterized membrane protein
MSAISSGPDQVELYLMHLNAAMLDIPRADRDEFLREIRAHIFEKLEAGNADVGGVLKALGDPEELARQFHSECSIRVSSRSWSPWVLMRAATRWALTGVQGFTVFIVAFFGYTLAACFYITAALKPIFPKQIGFYVSEQGLNLANWPTPHGHDLLGPYYTVVAFVLGFLIVAGTSFVVRGMMRKFAKVKTLLA